MVIQLKDEQWDLISNNEKLMTMDDRHKNDPNIVALGIYFFISFCIFTIVCPLQLFHSLVPIVNAGVRYE